MKRILIATWCLAAVASAEVPTAAPKQARIVFPDQAIENWSAEDDDTLYIEAHRKWYRADLFAPCRNLPFALAIGFESNPTSEFNRFSRIVVGGETCHLKSLVRVDGPPPKLKKHTA